MLFVFWWDIAGLSNTQLIIPLIIHNVGNYSDKNKSIPTACSPFFLSLLSLLFLLFLTSWKHAFLLKRSCLHYLCYYRYYITCFVNYFVNNIETNLYIYVSRFRTSYDVIRHLASMPFCFGILLPEDFWCSWLFSRLAANLL